MSTNLITLPDKSTVMLPVEAADGELRADMNANHIREFSIALDLMESPEQVDRLLAAAVRKTTDPEFHNWAADRAGDHKSLLASRETEE